MHPIIRIVRPTNDIPQLYGFYCDGLGLTVLFQFENHDGFDGAVVGRADGPYHLEFTHAHGHQVGRAPSQDNLLVFYIPDRSGWQLAVDRMVAAGFDPVPSFNPYWNRQGATFEDPDGYRVVLQHQVWNR